MSEYPKFLPKLDDEGHETDEGGIVVKNADEEAAALKKGHVARASVQPAGAPAAKGVAPVAHLEYPKHVYKPEVEGEERESKVVKNADEEAAALKDGYAALSAAVSEDLTAKDAIAAIRTSTDVAALEAALKTEDRSTVLDAIEARLAKLKPFDGLSAADAIEAIEASTDAVALQIAKGLESRKTVLAAIEARLAALSA